MKRANTGSVLDVLVSEAALGEESRTERHGVVVGTITDVDAEGRARVAISGSPPIDAVLARSIVVLDQSHVGQDVVVVFEHGDERRPIVLGVLCGSGDREPAPTGGLTVPGVEADVDGETLVLSAKREIVLRCGKASITLTRAGKILIKGDYLLSRSTGVNRIKGGSVQIN